MREPIKYEQVVQPNGHKKWLVSKAWKDWKHKQKMAAKKPKSTNGHEPLNEKNHKENWRLIAFIAGEEKRIYFCSCRAISGLPFAGCGAVAIQDTRSGPLQVVVESRFE